MTDINLTLPVAGLLSATAVALCWTVRTLWRLDRRIVRIETKLGLISTEDGI